MGKLRLSAKERSKLEILAKVRKGGISLRKAAELLRMSYRQVLRIWQRFVSEGTEGLKHRLRDQESNRRTGSERRSRVLELYESKYGDFGPTLAVEYLRTVDGESLSKETLRGWLIRGVMETASSRRRSSRMA